MGISGRELARRARVDRGTLAGLEHGRHKAYRSTILALAEALETEPWTLVGSKWTMSEKEKKAFERLVESEIPQKLFPEEAENDSD